MERLTANQHELFHFNVILLVLADWMQGSLLFQNALFIVEILKYTALASGMLAFYLEYRSGLKQTEMIRLCFIVLLAFMTCIKTKNMSYLLIVLIIVTAKNININDFIKTDLRVSVACAAIQVFAWVLNCFVSLGFPVYENVIEHRIGFLYVHPNMAAMKLGWMIIMWLWLRWDIVKKKDYFIAVIITSVLYYATKSDGCLLIYIFIFLMALKKNTFVRKTIVFSGKFVFFFLGIVSWGLSVCYMGYGKITRISQQLDLFFSRRFAMSYLAIKENGITLTGQSISLRHERGGGGALFWFGDYTIDSLYTYLFISVGVIWFLIISVGFYKLLHKENYKYAVAVVVFSLYATIELHCIFLPKCFVLLLLKNCLFDESKSKETNNLQNCLQGVKYDT